MESGKIVTINIVVHNGEKYIHQCLDSVLKQTYPHEQIEIKGRVGWLYHDLIHYSNPNLEKYLSGASKYTTLLANKIRTEKKNIVVIALQYLLINPIFIFFNLYLRHKGFLDGWRGFLFSLFSALHHPVAFFKYVASG